MHSVPADGHCLFRSIVHQLLVLSQYEPGEVQEILTRLHSLAQQKKKIVLPAAGDVPWSVLDELMWELRKVTAAYLRTHTEYVGAVLAVLGEAPVIEEEEEDAKAGAGKQQPETKNSAPNLPQPYKDYCDRIEKMPEWGGEAELNVISKLLQVTIVVLHGGAAPYEYGTYPTKIFITFVFTNLLPSLSSSSPSIWFICVSIYRFHRYLIATGFHYNSTDRVSDEKEGGKYEGD